MPEYLHPGVFWEEMPWAATPIAGVDTHNAAFLGATERGSLTPTLVTGAAEFARSFGGRFGNGKDYLPDAVEGFFGNGGKRLYVCRLVGAQASTASRACGPFRVSAIGPGGWGRRLWVRIDDSSARRADGSPSGFRLSAAYWPHAVAETAPFDPWQPGAGDATPGPQIFEVFDDLVTDPASPDHYARRLEAATLVTLAGDPMAPESEPARDSGPLDEGGDDGPLELGAADYRGEPTPLRSAAQGLAALSATGRAAALLYAPYPRQGAADVARELIAHCETTRTCFAIIDGEPGAVDPRLDPRAAIADSSRAAYYVPWLRVADPETPAGRALPPGGHVAGIYARGELARGVHKAPANEVVVGAVDLDSHLDDAALKALSERGVNAIRRFPGRGILVWGARTLSSDPEWRYVNVRRLVLWLEQSIAQGLRWAVFQPNDEALWRTVRRTVEIFLTEAWRGGALQGARADHAFFVRCDETTMTQADLDAGRLVCLIGVAPLKPAEFVIVRIGQWTASRPS